MRHPGHMNMLRLAELLVEAEKLPKNENGMVISASGVLLNSARSLKEMAVEPDSDVDRFEEHEARLQESQPLMAAHSLESMAKHFDMLRNAVITGDVAVVSSFFNLYVFD